MTDWRKVAAASAVNAGIKDPDIFVRQIGAESNFNPKAGSSAGAQGIAQIMPATAKSWKVDPWNPKAALDAAANNMARYLKSYKGDWSKALAAYNAGPGAVAKYGGVPPFKETKGYIAKILGGQKPSGAVGASRRTAAASSTPVASVDPGFSPLQQSALRSVFNDGPMRGLIEQAIVARGTQAVTPTPVSKPAGAAVTSNVAGGPGKSWKSLASWAAKNFDAHVQGDFQTTGGKHAPGSNHYKGTAIDLGDANTSRRQFNQIAAYARQHPEQFKELYFNKLGWGIRNGKIVKGLKVAGHDDHMHMAV